MERVEIGDAVLFCGSMEEVLPTLGRFDACVTDPPYGIGEARADNKSRSCLAQSKDYGVSDWDDAPCSDGQIAAMKDASKWQIIFGGNYFHLPPSSCWLVWDKVNGANDFADCELAWTNMPKAVRRVVWQWHGMIRKGREERFHPTQKPLGVMEWALQQLPPDVASVVDPFMGSGTTGVACVKRGLRFVGIERERKHFLTACRRIEEAYRQSDLFVPAPAAKPVQTALFGGEAA